MDSLELNKAAAAVLLAGIAFVGSGLVGKALVNPKEPEKLAINIVVPPPEGTAPAAAAPPEAPIGQLMAAADPARGEAQVKAQGCVACHSFNKGGAAGVGPNLYGVVGAPHGHMQGYQYSNALKAKEGPWTYAELNTWLLKPSAYAPGTKMSYAGLADPKKRADVIEYLRTLAESPEAKPPVEEAAAGATASAATPAAAAGGAPAGQSIAQRLAAADPKAGEGLTAKLGCIACHSFNEGGKAGIGPNLYGVVGGPIGHMQGYAYSAALKAHTGNWSYEELDKWLTKPAAFAQGTKMTFVGIADPKQRADVIDYLHSLAATPEPLPAP